jgi:phosphatidylinositol-3,4,5-trisphosphate 3-phosphatase/dual-specificity protein phosphatase PTEN
MGFPFQGLQALVRNSMADVIEYMEKKHKDKYMVYNLCAERFYDSQAFKGRVDNFGFEDHNPPPLVIMRPLCLNIHNWLTGDSTRVAAIHCKAGKGRTGTIIACYLLHSGQCKTASDALEFFGSRRTKDGKGVTIPSQIRYVGYYETCLTKGFPKRDVPMQITQIKWNQVPHGGVTPNCKVIVMGKEIYNMKDKTDLVHFEPGEEQRPVCFNLKIPVKGDFKVVFTNHAENHEKFFSFWLNTNMIEADKIVLKRPEIDSKGFKKLKFKRFQSDFMVVMKFDRSIGI